MTDAFDMGSRARLPAQAVGGGETVPAAEDDSFEARLLEQIAFAMGRQAAHEFLAGAEAGEEGTSND